MLRKIKLKEFKDLYRKHIVQDFPSSERPNLEGFRRRILKHNEQVFIYEENETEKGYCIIADLNEYVLVSFLAVYKETRGQGIGTKILKELEEKYSSKKGIFLEVENPDFAETEKEKNIQEKRIKFYQKSNFEIVPNLNVKLFMVNFKIMIYQKENKEINTQEVIDRINGYYSKIIDKKRLSYIEFEITE